MSTEQNQWVEVSDFDSIPEGAHYREEGQAYNSTAPVKWWYARPRPELPTVQDTVIRVVWKDTSKLEPRLFILWTGQWESSYSEYADPDKLDAEIESFDVVYTPTDEDYS